MAEPLKMTAVDPASLTFKHAWGAPLLAAVHDEGTSVLFRGEDGDLIVVADVADGSAMGIEGDVDGAGKGGVWLVGGGLPDGVAVVHVRDGDAWVQALVSAGERVWFVPIRAEQEVVRFEDAAGEVVAQALPAGDVDRVPIADAWTPCPACGACSWELIRWEEPGFEDEDDDDPEWGDPWLETAGRCTCCGHRVDGLDDEEWDEPESEVPAPWPASPDDLLRMVARGRAVYELATWAGDRFASGVGYVPDGELPDQVLLEYEDGERRVNVVTLTQPDLDSGVINLVIPMDVEGGPGAFVPDQQRSKPANSLAETLYYDEVAGRHPDPPEREVPLTVDGATLPLRVSGGPAQWVGFLEVSRHVTVVIEATGVDPAACSLRRVEHLDGYLSPPEDHGS